MRDWSISALTGFVIAEPVRSALLESLSKAGSTVSEADVVEETKRILEGSKWASQPRQAVLEQLGRLVGAGLVGQCGTAPGLGYELTEKGRKVAVRAFAPVNP